MAKRFLALFFMLSVALCLTLPAPARASGEDFIPAEPRVISLSVAWEGGGPVELIGEQPAVTLPVGSRPVFTVHFDNPDMVDNVYVVSTRNGDTRRLRAEERGGEFVTSGDFAPDDPEYVPGTITVDYSKKPVEVSEADTVSGIAMSALKARLEAQGITMEQAEIDPEGNVTAQAALGVSFGEMAGEAVKVSLSTFSAGAGVDQDELDRWLGVYKDLDSLPAWEVKGAAGKMFKLYFSDKDLSRAEDALILVRDLSTNTFTKVILGTADGGKLGGVALALDQTNLVSKSLLEYSAIREDADELREQVKASVMTQTEKSEAYRKINELERDRKLFMMGVTFIPALLTWSGAGVPLMISAITAGYTTMADYFWQRRIGMAQGCEPVTGAFSGGGGAIAITNAKMASGYQDAWITNGIILSSGHYYLAEDISVGRYAALTIGGFNYSEPIMIDVTIDLNGHTITGVRATSGSTHIYDSKYVKSAGVNNHGRIERLSASSRLWNVEHCVIGTGDKETTDRSYFSGGAQATISDCLLDGDIYFTGDDGSVCMENCISIQKITNSGTLDVRNSTIDGTFRCQNKAVTAITGSKVKYFLNGKNTTTTLNASEFGAVTNSEKGLIIKDGIVVTEGVSNTSSGKMTIEGGTISGGVYNQDGGELTINGGTIVSTGNRAVDAGGTVTINGGTISGLGDGVYTDGSGLRVNGGTISGKVGINAGLWGHVVICGGKITGSEYGLGYAQRLTSFSLQLKADSELEVSGGKNAVRVMRDFHNVSVGGAGGYSGSVTCYSSPDGPGVPMTLQQANDIDFSQPYLRLAGESVGLPSGGTVREGEHSMTVTPTAAGQDVKFTVAVENQSGQAMDTLLALRAGGAGGKMLSARTQSAQVAAEGSGSVEFILPRAQVEAGGELKLFWLDARTLAPVVPPWTPEG